MKRFGNLYSRIVDYNNLLAAYEMASKGKHNRGEVMDFATNIEANLLAIQRELVEHTYCTSDYEIFIKYEPKRREIYKLPFRDRIVHWAIMLVIEHIWVENFTRDTYACVKGRGIHACLRRLTHDLRRDPAGTAYCFKIDVRKFYPSIDHETLKGVIRKKIKDRELLWLLDEIIDSADGVPIGNYLSQFFANLYLSELDHLMKEDLRVRYYYRYADDIVVLAPTKEELRGVQIYINHYLNSERSLNIKGNYQIFPVDSRGIDFVGYVSFHTHTLMRKSIKQKFCREVAKLNKRSDVSEREYKQRVCSWIGWAKHCNSIHLLNSIGMKKFSDVRKSTGNFEGNKIRLDDILNLPIKLLAYQITNSHYRDQCLTIQIMIEQTVEDGNGQPVRQWEKRICFTGSNALMGQLDGVEIDPNDPLMAKIIKQELQGGRCFYKIVDPEN